MEDVEEHNNNGTVNDDDELNSQASLIKKSFQDDNPCWGTTEKNGLEHLLAILDKHKSILYESDEYLVLDKPPDLRMDGNYRSTVHKLTSYWYPSNTLLMQQEDKGLLQAVASLHKHNFLPDNQLRPIHQLDYATSGVLLIGRTKRATAVASECFRQRKVKKVYLAIVHGHQKLPMADMPILEHEKVMSTMKEAEKQYIRSKRPKTKRLGETFPGFLPVDTAFCKWQSHVKQSMKEQNEHSGTYKTEKHTERAQALQQLKRKRKAYKQSRGTVLEPHEFEKLVVDSIHLSEDDKKQLLQSKWSDVRSKEDWKKQFQELADCYNVLLKKKKDTVLDPPSTPLPRLFRVQGDGNGSEAIYIHAACAEVKGQFRMKIHPDPALVPPDDKGMLSGKQESSNLDFKPALTRCLVIAQGYMNGHPVTKVQLEPLTGRRHQLRLHMSVASSPIVGDLCYENEENPKNLCPRMCLHAHALSLDLSDAGRHTFVAPDPFLTTVADVAKRKEFVALVPGQ